MNGGAVRGVGHLWERGSRESWADLGGFEWPGQSDNGPSDSLVKALGEERRLHQKGGQVERPECGLNGRSPSTSVCDGGDFRVRDQGVRPIHGQGESEGGKGETSGSGTERKGSVDAVPRWVGGWVEGAKSGPLTRRPCLPVFAGTVGGPRGSVGRRLATGLGDSKATS